MITFRLQEHSLKPETQVIEIFQGNLLLGAIYPEEWGLRIVSKYLTQEGVEFDAMIPPLLKVKLP